MVQLIMRRIRLLYKVGKSLVSTLTSQTETVDPDTSKSLHILRFFSGRRGQTFPDTHWKAKFVFFLPSSVLWSDFSFVPILIPLSRSLATPGAQGRDNLSGNWNIHHRRLMYLV